MDTFAATPTPIQILQARIADLEALVASQADEIARLHALVTAQAGELASLQAAKGSDKNSRNSSIPPSQSSPQNRPSSATPPKKKGPRPGHPGTSRKRATPTFVVPRHPVVCSSCGADLSQVEGHVRARSQQVELPPLSPAVVEVICYRCFCPGCGQPNTAPYPAGWDPKQTFGPRLQLVLAYLHHQHHVSYQRLCALLLDLFGLRISQGALANTLSRTATWLFDEYEATGEKVRNSRVVGSDETRQRISGENGWEWVVQSATAAYHWIAPSRGSQELIDFFGEKVPEVQESDCYSAQLASPVRVKQVCHAHQLRDLTYAQEQGDEQYSPRMSRLIRTAIHLSRRRGDLSPRLFAHQAERLKRLGHRVGFGPIATNPFGEAMQRRYRRMEAWWWVFLDRADVSPTNNASERALRPAVVHRKVTGGFRSEWGAEAYSVFLSIVQTMQKEGKEIFQGLLSLLTPRDAAAALLHSDA